ncbi:MAG TPA: hypothetical protein VMY18_06600 [Acidobacteriota bacterium]|nr:hypothetical protein [Acidobacteriota bacterium]
MGQVLCHGEFYDALFQTGDAMLVAIAFGQHALDDRALLKVDFM